MKAIIATTAAPQALPSPFPLTEWGLTGAVIFIILQRGWEVFSKKEAAESKLIDSLVASMKENQTNLLNQLMLVQNQNHDDIKGLTEAIVKLSEKIEHLSAK